MQSILGAVDRIRWRKFDKFEIPRGRRDNWRGHSRVTVYTIRKGPAHHRSKRVLFRAKFASQFAGSNIG